jgi:HEAT repeat protein
MDPILPGFIGTCLFLGGFLYNHWRLQHWRDIVTFFDLHVQETSSFWALRPKLTAKSGPLLVRISGSTHGKGGIKLVVAVAGPPGFSRLKISRERPMAWRPREIEMGDDSFDKRFLIDGPMRLVFMMLDAEVRRLLSEADAIGALEISGGELRVETVDRQLREILPLLLDAGRRFAQRPDAAQRLGENAIQDPDARVRLKNLLLLIGEFPGEPRARKVLRAACSDPNLEVRLRAARELGAEGRGLLMELAENPEDDAVSAQAVSVLGRELPFERTKSILVHSLRRRRSQTARACLESIGHSGAAEAIGVLSKVMAREKGELATAAAQALGTTGSPAAEPSLIQALQRQQKDLRVASANALGRAGSSAAVLPLKEAAERFADPKLSQAARQAIAEIQSRLPGASPGQLSLAGAEAGQLSLAQAEAGQLSIATDPGGQISLDDTDED